MKLAILALTVLTSTQVMAAQTQVCKVPVTTAKGNQISIDSSRIVMFHQKRGTALTEIYTTTSAVDVKDSVAKVGARMSACNEKTSNQARLTHWKKNLTITK